MKFLNKNLFNLKIIQKELLEEFNKTTDELSTTLPEVNKSNYLLESKVIYAIEDGFIYNLNNGNKW